MNDIAAKTAAKIDAARDSKVNAVKAAAASGVEVQEAARLLAAAAHKYAKNYRAVLRADWIESDLRGFDRNSHVKKAGGRPRGRKTAQETAAVTGSSEPSPLARTGPVKADSLR